MIFSNRFLSAFGEVYSREMVFPVYRDFFCHFTCTFLARSPLTGQFMKSGDLNWPF